MKKFIPFTFSSIVFVLFDQITKLLAVKKLAPPQNDFEIIPNFFYLKYSENFGIAFSIPIPTVLIFVLNSILIGLIIYLAGKELNIDKKFTQILLALIVAGGISNLIDRFIYGFVVDFISIWIYPIFNVADIYITIGILLIISFYGKIKRTKK